VTLVGRRSSIGLPSVLIALVALEPGLTRSVLSALLARRWALVGVQTMLR